MLWPGRRKRWNLFFVLALFVILAPRLCVTRLVLIHHSACLILFFRLSWFCGCGFSPFSSFSALRAVRQQLQGHA
jgi:hypothetical protein